MYLGFLLALVGWCVFLSNVAAFVFLPLFILYMNRFQIRPRKERLRRCLAMSLSAIGPR